METQELARFKACVHCKHFRQPKGEQPYCGAMAALLPRSLITGQVQWQHPGAMRAKGNRHCGPDGKLWEAIPTPWGDRIMAARMATAYYRGAIAGAAMAPFRAVGRRFGEYRAALATIRDNATPPAEARDGQPLEPLPAPDKPADPAPTPDPSPLPQTEGALIVHPTANGQGQGGTTAGQTAAPHMALAVAVLLLGFIMAGVIGQDHARAMGDPMTVAPTLGCQANGKATCCYRMPDGSTRCFDCSTKA